MFLKKLLFLIVYIAIVEIIIAIGIAIIKNGYSTDSFKSMEVHANNGIAIAFVTINEPVAGLCLTLFALGYQYLQTISGQGILTNDDNIGAYLLGFAATYIVYILYRYFKVERKHKNKIISLDKDVKNY